MKDSLSYPSKMHAKIVINPNDEHKRTLIWLHEINAYAEEFESIFENQKLTPVDKNTKVILLNAGIKSTSVAYGMKMNSWFDIYTKISKIFKKLRVVE